MAGSVMGRPRLGTWAGRLSQLPWPAAQMQAGPPGEQGSRWPLDTRPRAPAGCEHHCLCSGPARPLPGLNYSCPGAPKLLQFYIFKYLIIRHEILMPFY